MDTKKLAGQTVMVTRPGGEDDALTMQLRDLALRYCTACNLHFRSARLAPGRCRSSPLAPVRVDRFFQCQRCALFSQTSYCSRRRFAAIKQSKVAAIGPATADELLRYNLHADVIPPEFRAESLAQSLAGEASGRRFLLIRASRGREILAEQLTAAGATVEQVVAYTSSDVDHPIQILPQCSLPGGSTGSQ